MTISTGGHIIAHFVIFVAYLIAVVRVPPAFTQIIRLRKRTMIAGSGFFLFCATTHFALAVGEEHHPIVQVTDHLQAVSIVAFLWFLTQDMVRAVSRLARAFAAIRLRFGPEAGETIEATIQTALRGD